MSNQEQQAAARAAAAAAEAEEKRKRLEQLQKEAHCWKECKATTKSCWDHLDFYVEIKWFGFGLKKTWKSEWIIQLC